MHFVQTEKLRPGDVKANITICHFLKAFLTQFSGKLGERTSDKTVHSFERYEDLCFFFHENKDCITDIQTGDFNAIVHCSGGDKQKGRTPGSAPIYFALTLSYARKSLMKYVQLAGLENMGYINTDELLFITKNTMTCPLDKYMSPSFGFLHYVHSKPITQVRLFGLKAIEVLFEDETLAVKYCGLHITNDTTSAPLKDGEIRQQHCLSKNGVVYDRSFTINRLANILFYKKAYQNKFVPFGS